MVSKKLSKKELVGRSDVRKKLGLTYTLKLITSVIDGNGLQDPDEVTITKQWNEFRALKGYWVDLSFYHPKTEPLVISLDVTPFYVRTIGNIQDAPLFTPGIHNYPKITKEIKKVKKAAKTIKK
jgi:hypothetical protein